MRKSDQFQVIAGGRRAVTLLCVLLVFGAETVFAAALPLFGSTLEFADATMIGLALSLSSGAGFLLLPFCSRWFDGGNMRGLIAVCGALMIVGSALVMNAHALGASGFLAGSLIFGAARIVCVVGLLTLIIKLPGSSTVNQGWNVSLQRLGSLAALLFSGVLFASGQWVAVFVLIIVVIAVLWWCADRAAEMGREQQSEVTAPIHREVIANLHCLKSPRVLAAASLIVLVLLALMHGNSFFSMAYASSLGAEATTTLVVMSVVLRDGVSVASGLFFPWVMARLGVLRMLWLLALLAAGPFVLFLALPGEVAAAMYVAAVAHGLLAGWGSASGNLLAAGTEAQGVGARIAVSQVPAGVVLVTAPLLFGAVVAATGVQFGYAVLAAVSIAVAGLMLRCALAADREG